MNDKKEKAPAGTSTPNLFTRLKNTRIKTKIIAGLTAAALAAGSVGAYVVMKDGSPKKTEAAETRVVSAEVTEGSISTTVTGTGTLANGDVEEIKMPDDLTIDEVLVESGDTVKEGQALATVDKQSLEQSISEIQESISDIDESIEKLDDEETEETVTTAVGGRIKKVNIAAGDDVTEAMETEPSLMVISADGYMAVEISETDLTKGDSVTVTLSDGTSVSGTVSQVTGSKSVITVSDEYGTDGESVKVLNSSGKEIGSGTLSISQPYQITAAGGTVSEVYVSVGDEVEAGDSLFYLTDIYDQAEQDRLLTQRAAYVSMLQDRTNLLTTLTITSPKDGVIADVYAEEGEEVSSGTSTSSSSSSGSSASSSSKSSSAKTVSYTVKSSGSGANSSGSDINSSGSGANVATTSGNSGLLLVSGGVSSLTADGYCANEYSTNKYTVSGYSVNSNSTSGYSVNSNSTNGYSLKQMSTGTVKLSATVVSESADSFEDSVSESEEATSGSTSVDTGNEEAAVGSDSNAEGSTETADGLEYAVTESEEIIDTVGSTETTYEEASVIETTAESSEETNTDTNTDTTTISGAVEIPLLSPINGVEMNLNELNSAIADLFTEEPSYYAESINWDDNVAVLVLKTESGYYFDGSYNNAIQLVDSVSEDEYSWSYRLTLEDAERTAYDTLTVTMVFTETEDDSDDESDTDSTDGDSTDSSTSDSDSSSSKKSSSSSSSGSGSSDSDSSSSSSKSSSSGSDSSSSSSKSSSSDSNSSSSNSKSSSSGSSSSGSSSSSSSSSGSNSSGSSSSKSSSSGSSSSGSSSGSSSSGSSSGSSSSGSSSGSSSSGSSSSSSSSGSGSSGSSSTTTSQDLYEQSQATVFTLQNDDEMQVTISVDELDILSISEGQEVAITLDAIEGETFTGTVSAIGTGSSSNSGVSKYSVTVVVPKAENMLAGMTASATVIVDSAEGVFVIPAAAIQESHGESYVYTELDEEGNPTGKVTVETGLSDGSKVEVSGELTQGQTVYYTEATGSDIETEEEETSERGEMGQMGGFGGSGGPGGSGGSGGPSGSGGSGGPGGSGGSGGSAQRPSGNGGGPGA